MSRISRRLRGAGLGGDERASAGGGPRAQSAPDPGAAPQNHHHLATSLRGCRLGSSPPAVRSADTPGLTGEEGLESRAGPRTTTSRARRRPAPEGHLRRRRSPRHQNTTARTPTSKAPSTGPPPQPPVCTGPGRGSPTLPPPQRPTEGRNPASPRHGRGGSARVAQKSPFASPLEQ